MIGILSVGGHVPRYRLSGKALGAVWGVGSGGERAVANAASAPWPTTTRTA